MLLSFPPERCEIFGADTATASVSNQIIFDALQALRKKNDTESMAVPLACRSDLPSKSGQRIQVKSVVHFSASGCDVAAHQVQDPQPEAPAP